RREAQQSSYWADRGRRDATVRSRSPATTANSPQADVQARGNWGSTVCSRPASERRLQGAMDYAGAHRAYTESSILTAPPERLVVMLYDGAIRFLKQAAAAERGGQHQMFLDRLRRGEAIIDELNVTLDMSQGEVAAQLRSIYLFCKRHLVQAHLKCDAGHIDEVVRLLTDLRESWQQLAVQGATEGRPATAT